MKSWRLRNWIAIGALAVLAGYGFGVGGCALKRLPNVGSTISGPAASPAVLGYFGEDPPITSAQEWESRRLPLLRAAFAEQIYGAMPLTAPVSIVSRKVLKQPSSGPVGMIERISVRIDVARGAEWPTGAPIVDMIVMTPRGQGPFPVLAGGTFCSNSAALPGVEGVRTVNLPLPKECGGAIPPFVVEAIFGRNANKPPFEAIAAAGYALAFWHPGDVVPDDPLAAIAFLKALTPAGTSPDQQTGAIAAWAWTLSRMTDVLIADPRLDPRRISFIGHSRHGKAALLAAATDPRAAAVWALQSGTAGAALGRDDVGEPTQAITASYPHWFSPAYAAFANRQSDVTVDQHQLIAMIAPRPVLIGTGRRDQWGDPHGSYRALVGASPAYELFSARAFAQSDLKVAATLGPLAFYMRGGLHGIHSEDWREALAFFTSRDPHLP
jgi:hypothetical protein